MVVARKYKDNKIEFRNCFWRVVVMDYKVSEVPWPFTPSPRSPRRTHLLLLVLRHLRSFLFHGLAIKSLPKRLLRSSFVLDEWMVAGLVVIKISMNNIIKDGGLCCSSSALEFIRFIISLSHSIDHNLLRLMVSRVLTHRNDLLVVLQIFANKLLSLSESTDRVLW